MAGACPSPRRRPFRGLREGDAPSGSGGGGGALPHAPPPAAQLPPNRRASHLASFGLESSSSYSSYSSSHSSYALPVAPVRCAATPSSRWRGHWTRSTTWMMFSPIVVSAMSSAAAAAAAVGGSSAGSGDQLKRPLNCQLAPVRFRPEFLAVAARHSRRGILVRGSVVVVGGGGGGGSGVSAGLSALRAEPGSASRMAAPVRDHGQPGPVEGSAAKKKSRRSPPRGLEQQPHHRSQRSSGGRTPGGSTVSTGSTSGGSAGGVGSGYGLGGMPLATAAWH